MVSASVGGYNVDIHDILTVQRPVMLKHAGASASKINDNGVSTLKQACSRQYSVLLKLKLVVEGLNMHRIEALLS